MVVRAIAVGLFLIVQEGLLDEGVVEFAFLVAAYVSRQTLVEVGVELAPNDYGDAGAPGRVLEHGMFEVLVENPVEGEHVPVVLHDVELDVVTLVVEVQVA